MCLQISTLGFLHELLSKILKAEIRIKTKTNTGSLVALILLAHLILYFLTRCSTHNQLTHILEANHLYQALQDQVAGMNLEAILTPCGSQRL